MHILKCICTATILFLFSTVLSPVNLSYAEKAIVNNTPQPIPKTPSSKLKLTEEEKTWLRLHPIITVGCDNDWAPVEFRDENKQYHGVTIDYLDILSDLLGVKFEFTKNKAWSEIIAKAKKGEIDLLPTVSPSKDRKEYLYFAKPHLSFPVVIYTQKDVSFIPNIKNLIGQKVAIVNSYAIHDWLSHDYPDLDLILCDTVSQGVEKLNEGEVFAYIGTTVVTGYNIRNSGYINIKVAGETEYAYNLGMAVPKKHKTLLNIINKAFKTITPEQRHHIYTKWITAKYQYRFNYKLLWKILGGIALLIVFFLWSNLTLRRAVAKRTKALSTSEKQYRDLFENANDSMFILQDDIIIETNQRAADLFGFRNKKNLIGKHVHQLSPEFQNDGQLSRIKADILIHEAKKGKYKIFEWQHLKQEGKIIHSEISLSQIEIDGKLCILAIVRDITPKKQAEEAILKAQEKTEKMYKKKNIFLAGLSTEIRTPLNGILGFAELLQDHSLTNKEMQEYIKIIKQNSKRMLHILTDLIDLSKIESETIDFHTSKNSTNEIMNEAYNTYKIKALSKGLKLNLSNTLSDEESIIDMDSTMISRVIANLLNNAIKFTESGIIDFGYEKKGNMLEFYIRDTGIGIKEKMYETIFEPFKKITNLNKDAGLGLSIAKAFVEKHNGKIWVKSKRHEGSTFYFTLPHKANI